MATPVVESFETGSGANVTMPAGVVAGDGLLIFMGTDGVRTYTPPAGWTELLDTTYNSAISCAVFYKKADGTEGVSQSATVSGPTAHICYRISGVDFDVHAPEVGTTATTTAASVTPPSYAHSKGIDDYLYFAFTAHDTYLQTLNTFPTGYVGTGVRQSGASGAQCEIGYCYKGTTATTSDTPSAFVWSGGTDDIAFLVAVPTSGGGAPTLSIPFASGILANSIVPNVTVTF